MILKENIVRIKEMMGLVTESKAYLLRRVTVDKINTEFKESLDYVTYKLKGNYGLKKFKDRVMTVMMDGLHYNLGSLLPKDIKKDVFP